MPTIERGQHVSVLGETGTGKTYWAQHYLAKERRVIVVDTEEGYDFKEKEWRPVTLSQLDHSGVLQHEDRAFHFAFRPRDGEEEADVESLCQLVLKKGRNLIVYFDEITDYSDANRCGPWLKKMFRKARKRQH
jgi:KaiC/GvpD/RAD55 family RecA-like ATPase